jgi:hypothetical protein
MLVASAIIIFFLVSLMTIIKYSTMQEAEQSASLSKTWGFQLLCFLKLVFFFVLGKFSLLKSLQKNCNQGASQMDHLEK